MPIRTARAGKPTGVWELEALQAAIDRGEVLPTDLVWTSGLPDWKELHSVAHEIGITLPEPDEEVPPIPGSEPPVPPPIPRSSSATQPPTHTASTENFRDLKFRKDTTEKSGCRGPIFALVKILAIAIAGSIVVILVISGIFGDSERSGVSEQDQHASSSAPPPRSPQAIEYLFKPLSRHIKVENCRASSTYNVGTDCTVLYTCGTGLSEAFGLRIDMSDFQIAQYRQGVRSSQDLKMIANIRVDEPTDVHIFGDVDDDADEYRLFMHGEEVKDGSVLFDPSNPFYKSNICPL